MMQIQLYIYVCVCVCVCCMYGMCFYVCILYIKPSITLRMKILYFLINLCYNVTNPTAMASLISSLL